MSTCSQRHPQAGEVWQCGIVKHCAYLLFLMSFNFKNPVFREDAMKMLPLQIPSKCDYLGQASHPLIALPLPTLPGENLSETVLRAVAGEV